MNGTIPGRSFFVPFEDGEEENIPLVTLRLVQPGKVEEKSLPAGEEVAGYDVYQRSRQQHSAQSLPGPFLVAPQPKGHHIRFDLGLRMSQSETGLNETGVAEFLAGGTSSYTYPSTDFVPYETGGSEARTRTEVRQYAHLPSSLFRYRVVKRVGDLLLAAVAMPVLLPVLIVLTLLVKLTSPGPAFFSHRRLCMNGAFFSMWKFRTMCVNSSEVLEHYLAAHPEARAEWNQTHKLRYDPRVTKIGRVMRQLSLDELPQIWNVITGRMSLVGPRPIVAAEVEKYAECFACYARVKPGVTGLWQVSGRSRLSYDERVKLDCEYVTHWSLICDLKILALTVKSVVNQDGAY